MRCDVVVCGVVRCGVVRCTAAFTCTTGGPRYASLKLDWALGPYEQVYTYSHEPNTRSSSSRSSEVVTRSRNKHTIARHSANPCPVRSTHPGQGIPRLTPCLSVERGRMLYAHAV